MECRPPADERCDRGDGDVREHAISSPGRPHNPLRVVGRYGQYPIREYLKIIAVAILTSSSGNFLTTDDDVTVLITEPDLPAIPAFGKSRREHGLGGAIYKIVNSPGP